MDLKRLEFDMILQGIKDEDYSIKDEYTISVIEDGLVVKLQNKDVTVNLDKVIVFKAQKLNGVTYKFTIKPEYLRFDNIKFINESYLYKRLFGYSMNLGYKRLLIFLSCLTKKEMQFYLDLVSKEIHESMEKFFKSELEEYW